MPYFFLLFFALAPSVIWLLFYLRKDAHPESNSTVLKIFFLGAASAIAAAFTEYIIAGALNNVANLDKAIFAFLYWFLAIAMVEEFFKYLVVSSQIFRSEHLDEPLDLMLYMIISALGFAALENVLIFFSLKTPLDFWQGAAVSIFRFLGATLLHALASGLFGYFLVVRFYEAKRKLRYFFAGLFSAVVFHGLFNLSIANPKLMYKSFGGIINENGVFKFIIPIIILSSLAFFVSYGFKKVKNFKGICKIK